MLKLIVLPLIMSLMLISSVMANTHANMTKLVLATGNWEPYYGETLADGGIVTDIVRLSLQRVGYELEVKWYPWPRAIETAKKGLHDGVLGAWFTDERAQYFTYTQPFFKNEIVFFKRKGMPITYKSLDDLKAYQIGVTNYSGPYELLMKSVLADNLNTVTHATSNIHKLLLKRVDLIADEKLGVGYIIATRFPEWAGKIEALEPPLQVNQLYVMFSKLVENHKQLADSFNLGLLAIIEDGTFQQLFQKHGFVKTE